MQAPMQLPARVGKYELVEFLGGGMSHVYRATDTVLGRTVALKMLTEAGCADAEAKARFLHEARMAGNIVHDNIISVYDFGEEHGRPFIVMEFLRGESLREAIKYNRTGDLKSKLSAALQIARALGYIHTKKIIHRDVKPENIHLDTQGKVKLMDFGIAKSEGLQLTRAGFTLGTPYYMAPEQVLGQQVTPLVDIYAFGVLLFELISGAKAVSGDTVERIFNQILYEPLNLDPLKLVGAPQAIFDLINGCTSKAPVQRIQSFDIVAKEIERLLENPALLVAAPVAMATAAPASPAPAQQAAATAAKPAPARKAPAPPRPAPAAVAAADLPAFMSALPEKFRTQTWLMAFAAVFVLGAMLVLYLVLAALKVV